MGFYFRLGHGIGVSMPWYIAIFVWLMWLYGLMLVGAIYLIGWTCWALFKVGRGLVEAIREGVLAFTFACW